MNRALFKGTLKCRLFGHKWIVHHTDNYVCKWCGVWKLWPSGEIIGPNP